MHKLCCLVNPDGLFCHACNIRICNGCNNGTSTRHHWKKKIVKGDVRVHCRRKPFPYFSYNVPDRYQGYWMNEDGTPYIETTQKDQ